MLLLSQSKFQRSSNLPPGPRKLPLIGNLHLFATFRPLHRTLAELAKKHGPLMHLQIGQISTVVISSPEVAKHVYKTHDTNFSDRPSLLVMDILFYKNTDLVFNKYSDYWRQLRRICTAELLHMRRVQSFKPIRREEGLKLCRWIASREGSLINLTERISLNICENIKRASVGENDIEGTTFLSIIKETSELGGGFYLPDVYPSVRLFRWFSSYERRAERLHQKADSILQRIIDDHRRITSDSKQHEDLVDVLLKFTDDGNEFHLTIDNIKAVILDMFLAGIESSFTTTDWAMVEVLKHPRVLKKAQDEVRRVFKDKEFIDEDDFDELKYLKLVIKETLRMHLPGTLLLPRENREACQINGYEIPAKTRILVNAWLLGRDPEYWEDADSFIPERYIDESVDYKGTNFNYIPFGGGKRICPGMSLGLMNVEFTIAMLLYHFDWCFPEGVNPENLDITESFGISAYRKSPLYVIPILKKALPAI